MTRHRPSSVPVRRGTLSGWLLLALPLLLLLMFVAQNVQLMNCARATQERTTDTSALAAAQIMVDDRMLMGNPSNISTLESLAAAQAQLYANYNPIGPVIIQYAQTDVVFTTSANPLNANLQLVTTVQVTGQRTGANGNALNLFGGGAFWFSSVPVITQSTALLDRQVAGFRTVFAQNVPLAAIAFSQSDWVTQIEASYNPPPLPTYTVTLGTASGCFIQIGTGDDSGLANQLVSGVTPAQLSSAPYGGAFILPSSAGLTVPLLSSVSPPDLDAALDSLIGVQRAWPLFSTQGSGAATVVRFVAARITTVTDNGNGTVTLTLQPTFLADPSVVTSPAFGIDPYLCRVHLTPAQ